MLRFTFRTAGVLSALVLLLPEGAGAETAPSADFDVELLNAIPGAVVTASADGTAVAPATGYKSVSEIGDWSGRRLELVLEEADGTETPMVVETLSNAGNWTIAVHLDPWGEPAVTSFQNDLAATAPGAGRITIRHCAEMEPIDILRNGTPLIGALGNGVGASIDVAAGVVDDIEIALVDQEPVVALPVLELSAGASAVVYLTGSLDGETFEFIEMAPDVVGTTEGVLTPARVDTGAPISRAALPPLYLSVGLFLLAGLLMSLRRCLGRR